MFVFCSASPATALEKVTLQLKWLHQFQFAGYYAAEQQGYYRDAGLNVTIKPATPGKDPVLDVIDGKAQYGVGTSSLLLLRNAGKPVVALAVMFQHSPYILLTKELSASQTIHSLAGKRLMLEPQADELVAYLKNEGITLEKMQLVDHSYNLKDLMGGKVDVVSGYVTDDPDVLDRAGFPYHAYTPRAAGIDFYGDNLFTTENELKNNPDRVKAFREASLKGWQYALQHPDEIIELIISKYSPQADRAHLKYEAEQVRQLVQPNLVEIGYMHAGRWQHIADTYAGLGMMPKKIDLKKFMYDPHPDQDLTLVYRIAALGLCIVLVFIAVRLVKTSRNLKISEEKFFKAFENAPLMKTIGNLENGVFLDVNAKFCEKTGFAKSDIIGRNSSDIGLLTPKDRQKLLDAFQHNGRFSDVELKLHTSTGAIRDCIYFGEVIKVGNAKQLLCVILDVTEHKQNEEQIRKLSQAVEQSPVTVVITDTNGTIEFVNSKFTQMTGYSSEEAIGQNPRILRADDNPVELYRKLWKTIRAGGVWEGELHNRKKNGELFWERAAISPLRNSDGVITHYLGIKEDITEQKKVRQQLLQSQKIEAIGQLTGGLAHDFNNLLSVIGGYANMLEMRMPPDDKGQPMLQQILRATEKAGNLTHSLLAFSRKQIMKTENINLNTLIFQFGTFIKRVIGEDIVFSSTMRDAALYVHADSGQIEQVLINLATNARDAMPDGGLLSMETGWLTIDDEYIHCHGYGTPGNYAMLSVTDTGIGMDESTSRMIFEPFFTTKEVGKGTGLGMAMVYGIIKQHNGFITVYSEKGHGTVFRIYLPLVEEQSKKGETTSSEQPPAPVGCESILVVEDDQAVQQLLKEILATAGYEILLAGDGKEALQLYADNHARIQLVVMDMVMPVMGGRDAYREMQKIKADVRVLFCSGYSLDMLQKKGDLGDQAECILKPVLPRQLLKKVREVLDRPGL
jgi:PAS domain S-box-containing protein